MTVQNGQDTKLFITGAAGFWEAAEAISKRRNMFHWPAFYVNLSYAIELMLKAFLASRGSDRAALKKLGHRLAKGYENAVQAGYQPPSTNLLRLIDLIDGKLLSFRYLEGGSIEITEEKTALEIVEVHLHSIAEQIPIGELPYDE